MKGLTPREEMGAKILLLFWLIGFCLVMSFPIWLNSLFGFSIITGMLFLSFGFCIWMFVLAILVT